MRYDTLIDFFFCQVLPDRVGFVQSLSYNLMQNIKNFLLTLNYISVVLNFGVLLSKCNRSIEGNSIDNIGVKLGWSVYTLMRV